MSRTALEYKRLYDVSHNKSKKGPPPNARNGRQTAGLLFAVIIRPCYGDEAFDTGNDHIVVAAGAVDDEQISVLISTADDADMFIAGIEYQIAG